MTQLAFLGLTKGDPLKQTIHLTGCILSFIRLPACQAGIYRIPSLLWEDFCSSSGTCHPVPPDDGKA